jgi:hypothetical protein
MKPIERLFTTLCLGATLSAPTIAEQASFQGLGMLGNGEASISADGTTVIRRRRDGWLGANDQPESGHGSASGRSLDG